MYVGGNRSESAHTQLKLCHFSTCNIVMSHMMLTTKSLGIQPNDLGTIHGGIDQWNTIWRTAWRLKSRTIAKPFPQKSHLCGLSPECLYIKCSCRWCLCRNVFGHLVHWNGRSFVCILMWLTKAQLLEKVFLQMVQVQSRQPTAEDPVTAK
jgi:hypothetical protein